MAATHSALSRHHSGFPDPPSEEESFQTPRKRRRLISESETSACISGEGDLSTQRIRSSIELRNRWISLADKYSAPLDEDDVVDVFSGEVVLDRGTVRTMAGTYEIGDLLGKSSFSSDSTSDSEESSSDSDEEVSNRSMNSMRTHRQSNYDTVTSIIRRAEPSPSPESEDELGIWGHLSGLDFQYRLLRPLPLPNKSCPEDMRDLREFEMAERTWQEAYGCHSGDAFEEEQDVSDNCSGEETVGGDSDDEFATFDLGEASALRKRRRSPTHLDFLDMAEIPVPSPTSRGVDRGQSSAVEPYHEGSVTPDRHRHNIELDEGPARVRHVVVPSAGDSRRPLKTRQELVKSHQGIADVPASKSAARESTKGASYEKDETEQRVRSIARPHPRTARSSSHPRSTGDDGLKPELLSQALFAVQSVTHALVSSCAGPERRSRRLGHSIARSSADCNTDRQSLPFISGIDKAPLSAESMMTWRMSRGCEE